MTVTEETRANFTYDCLLDPWDDTPRLVFADFLAEHGEEDRANLIRLQVELARMSGIDPDCPNGPKHPTGDRHYLLSGRGRIPCVGCWPESDAIRRREKDILSRHTGDQATGERWDRLKCPACEGPDSVGDCSICDNIGNLAERYGEQNMVLRRERHWDRGFLHLGCQIAEAVEERECVCYGSGWEIPGPTNQPRCPKCMNSSQNAVVDGSPHLRRCASCKTVWEPKRCAPCSGTGRIPTITPWGGAVLDAGAGLWLEVEPFEVRRMDGGYHYFWARPSLPAWLWELLADEVYPSIDAAELSLARAFTAFAARQVQHQTAADAAKE